MNTSGLRSLVSPESCSGTHNRPRSLALRLVATVGLLLFMGAGDADVPGGRPPPQGTAPNPGTQQQELANITAPAPYNVYEFVVTCAACHGGTIDQQAAHFGNWSGSSMASAARDPVFRANQIGIELATGNQGAGNICFRCHSPNGWYSGRFDPTLAGDPTGATMIHSIVASTDDEGILCEFCHRAIGSVTMKRPDLDSADPVWNMLAGIDDWPHLGLPYTDQVGDPTIPDGNPYGDTTLQIDDGMTYVGKYSGSVDVYMSDLPTSGTYTGQTYGIYPDYWTTPLYPAPDGEPLTNSAGEMIVYNVDGSVSTHFESPIGPPIDPLTGTYDYQAMALSLEHPTFGDRPLPLLPQPVPHANDFIRSSEFCGACHDLTIPLNNHGMPEQRTYTEWKFSAFGNGDGISDQRCQDCHMPTLKHEYTDDIPVSLNPDPTLAGWFPYAKDRNPNGGTTFHKFAGANLGLPMMMKVLYPEVDMEVIGAPTGNDTRIFPGMLSNRDPMWQRTLRNTQIMLQEGVSVEVAQAPTYDATTARWTVQVKVTNNAGHRIPSGYPEGRRFWIDMQVSDSSGAVVYESGHYDQASATLYTDSRMTGFQRALEPTIDAADNAVMVYERIGGECADTSGDGTIDTCTPSHNLLNQYTLFDNRIPPAGFDYASLRLAGVKFWNYDPATNLPYEDLDRYTANFDLVTYTFDAPADAVLNAQALIYWQTHSRELMDFLKDQDVSTLRPEGPPSILDPNYPLNPTYLSDVINLSQVEKDFNVKLLDNWGGIAYAAWLVTGKGAPHPVAMADTADVLPAAPTNVLIQQILDPVTGINDPFTQVVSWDPVEGADGYLVWIRYGLNDLTAAWDKLAVVQATSLTNTALNVGKSYAYKVQAFNGAGMGPESLAAVGSTPIDLPLPPENLQFVSSTATTIDMSWLDVSDNEIGWIVYRQDVPPVTVFAEIARFDSTTATGGVPFTDGDANPAVTWAAGYTPPQPSQCYNYVVEAYNASGLSGWNINGPVQMCTLAVPTAPTNLTAVAVSSTQVDLSWTASEGVVDGYRIERSLDGTTGSWQQIATGLTTTSYSDLTVVANTTYYYRVFAYNTAGESPASNVATVTTPSVTPAAPSNLTAVADSAIPGVITVALSWTDNADNEDGFIIERALLGETGLGPWTVIATIAPMSGVGGTVNYIDTNVEPKMTYYYRVAAFNASGVSPYSNEAMVVTPGEIPEAPTDLRILSVWTRSISITWVDNSLNELGFHIERSTDGVNWLRIATTPANSQAYTDTGLRRRTTYWYRVQAYNNDGVSAYTNVVSATTR